MSQSFVVNRDMMKAEGNTIIEQSQQFNQNVEKIFSTVEEMLSSNYLSPAAKVLANRIKSNRDSLNAMTRVINDYGNYCINASNTVMKNEQNIIDNITGRGGVN